MKNLILITLATMLSMATYAQYADDVYHNTAPRERKERTAGDHLIRSGRFHYYAVASAVVLSPVFVWSGKGVGKVAGKVKTDHLTTWADATPYIMAGAAASTIVLYFTVGGVNHKIKAGKKLNSLNLSAHAHPTGVGLTLTF